MSLALSNKAIERRTDSEEEGATTERCRRRMDRLVKDGDEQLNHVKTRARPLLVSTYIHLLEENIEKLVNLGWRDQASCQNLWDISPLDDNLPEAKVGHWSCFYVSANNHDGRTVDHVPGWK